MKKKRIAKAHYPGRFRSVQIGLLAIVWSTWMAGPAVAACSGKFDGVSPTREQLQVMLAAHRQWAALGHAEQKHDDGRRANLCGVILDNAVLRDVDLRGANLAWSRLTGAELQRADLSWADLSGAIMRQTNLSRAILIRTRMRFAILDRAILNWANLSGADFRKADLVGAQLRGADLSVVDMQEASLRNADLSGADLRRGNFYRADLAGADLRGADLRGVSFREANLTGVDLRGADLNEVDFANADLTGIDLRGASVQAIDIWAAEPPAGAVDRKQFADETTQPAGPAADDVGAELPERESDESPPLSTGSADIPSVPQQQVEDSPDQSDRTGTVQPPLGPVEYYQFEQLRLEEGASAVPSD